MVNAAPLRLRRIRAKPKNALAAAAQILRASVPLGAGRAKGSAETPFVMNREIGRPAGALQAGGAAGIGDGAAHLIERRLGVLLAEGGIGGVRRGQPGKQ